MMTIDLTGRKSANTPSVLSKTARIKDKPDVYSPYRKFRGTTPFARLLPFLKPASHQMKGALKSEVKAEPCSTWAVASTTRSTAARSCSRLLDIRA